MNSPAPLWLVLPTIVIAGLIGALRWWLVDDIAPDRLVNWGLTWCVLGLIIEESGKGTDYADLTYRIFLACGMVCLSKIYGLAALFDGADPKTAAARQRQYDSLALLAAVVVLITGRPVDPGEAGFLWRTWALMVAFNIPLVASSIRGMRACVRELRVAGLSALQRLAFGVLLFATTSWLLGAVLSAGKVLSGGVLDTPGEHWTASACASFAFLTSLAAIPVVRVLSARGGLDRASRIDRKLRPLWEELTAAVPEVVLTKTDVADSELRLYRMTVEIHDALQHLRQFVPDGKSPASHRTTYAIQMVRAAQAKAASGGRTGIATDIENQRSQNRDVAAELEHLMALAKKWPRAKAVAQRDPAGRW
ncbi:MAB_1171c family putative transporter [Nocardia sp. NPDC050712]|uniref:MAB_1171c family putative transporter n=1 Tax=Nocardia sp. NPDC050712 TaxID=3155518 RepID=UPI0033C0EC3D